MRDEKKTEEQLTNVAKLQRRVTELETLETECQQAQEMLRKSEKRFQNIFDHSNDAIFVIDAGANEILDVNSKACTMLGYPREELLSTPVSAIHPDEMPKLLAFAKSVSRNGQGWTDELRCLTKAGRFLPTEISASLIDMSGRLCTIALIRDISKRKQVEEELYRTSQRMKGDLEMAAKIQESLLPQAPPDVAGMSFAWAFKPCDELAGDIFNVFLLDEKEVGLYLLDVSGHGVVAALLSVVLSRILSPAPSPPSVLKQCSAGSEDRLLPPAEVAEQLNKQFPMDLVTRQYFTLLYGMLNVETREFRYVSAGHPGPVYLSGTAEPVILEVSGFPIGFFEGVLYEEHSVGMKPGDRLYLYSDGVTEALNRKGQEFGKERLIRALDQSRSGPLKESVASLLETIEECCDARLEDDISVLAIEITP